MIVDNAWNRDRQESEASLAKGEATLERLVEWFLSEQLSWGRIATIGPRNALVFADFQWGLSHLDEKSPTRTVGSHELLTNTSTGSRFSVHLNQSLW